MAASRLRLEALLARVQKRATEPRSPSAAVAPILEAVKADAQSRVSQGVLAQNAAPQNEVGDEDIEEYDDELIEIIDDAEVIPQAAAVARAIEPAAFGAAVDRRPAAAIRSEPSRNEPTAARAPSTRPPPETVRPESPRAEALRGEAVAPRPPAATDVARARGTRRELRQTSFVELLDASLKLG